MAIIVWKTGTLPEPWSDIPSHYWDGDTIAIGAGPQRRIVRIFGIDAPEWGQTGAIDAQLALKSITDGCTVTVSPIEMDRYGRVIARLATSTHPDIALHLLQLGLVWWEYRWAPGALEYRDAQKQARREKLGLWRLTDYGFAPWEFRRRRGF